MRSIDSVKLVRGEPAIVRTACRDAQQHSRLRDLPNVDSELNGDRKLDIAVSLYPFPQEAPPVYLNRGDGTFAPIAANAFLSTPPSMFALLDANCDGRIDLFGSTHASPSEPNATT